MRGISETNKNTRNGKKVASVPQDTYAMPMVDVFMENAKLRLKNMIKLMWCSFWKIYSIRCFNSHCIVFVQCFITVGRFVFCWTTTRCRYWRKLVSFLKVIAARYCFYCTVIRVSNKFYCPQRVNASAAHKFPIQTGDCWKITGE